MGAAISGRSAADLDALILRTHEEDDRQGLAVLYEEAGERAAAKGQADAACFFWTQAWIFALDAGAGEVAARVERRLAAHGRMAPPQSGAISSTTGK